MISASHLIVGGAVGRLCPRARVAVPVAFASHFLMDQVPHSCFNMLPGRDWVVPELLLTASALACVIGLVLTKRLGWVVIAAAFVGCLPDVLDYVPPISDWFHMAPGSAAMTWVHATFHIDVTRSHCVLGFATQAVAIALGLWIIARTSHSKRSY